MAAALAARFPDVDLVTIEETLTLCDGDSDKCAALLTDVLADEAASARPSMLRTLFDAVSLLAQLPRASQPADQRERVLMLCAALEVNGIKLLQPVNLMLDGERGREAVAAGLDEADRVVALQLLDLIEAGGGSVDGLSAAEREALAEEFGTAPERTQARELERLLEEKSKSLERKEAELKALKMKVIKQRMGTHPPTGQGE
jgi:hypothetical protein